MGDTNMEKYVLSYDIGTTGVKTCLFRIDQIITLLESASMGYGLTVLENGGVEQNVDEWWEAMCVTTKKVFSESSIEPEQVDGISFCSQMQGVVVVDKECNALRPAMSYMDQRAKQELKETIAYGPQVAGANLFKFLPYFYYTHAVSSSVKDPIFKYLWIKNNEPEVYDNIYKWLDVKEYLIARCTGKCVMTEDSAFATLLYDTRKGHEGWSDQLCDMMGIYKQHLPTIVKSTDEVGPLTKQAAEELGLVPGIAVFGGGGDASLIPVGAGAVAPGDTHIYSGTSGWVGTVLDKQKVDVFAMIAAIVGAQEGRYNYFAEMETAAKCVEWVKDHLALDEVDIYLDKHDVTENKEGFEAAYTSLYDYLTEIMRTVPAGSGGVIFTPWLHGNRCPFEHHPGDRQAGNDPLRRRGRLLPPAMDAGTGGQARQDLRHHPLRRRRRPVSCDLPDPRRRHRPEGRDRSLAPERGSCGGRRYHGRGPWGHQHHRQGQGLHPR